MTQKEAYELTKKLYECSLSMKEINSVSSDLLLEMASAVLDGLENSTLPDKVKEEIQDIKKELLDE